MTKAKSEGVTDPATSLCGRLDGAKETAANVSGALRAGGSAYVTGILELNGILGGFGREIAVEAGRHLRATIAARSLPEVAELQAAWVQHRIETSTAQTKELADLAHTKTMDVIAPFAALLKHNTGA